MVITDVPQRKGILKQAGRCFVCLRRHHLHRDCRSSTMCVCCNSRHHTGICNTYVGSQGKRKQQGSDSQNCVNTGKSQLLPKTQAPQQEQLQPPQLQSPQTGYVGQQGTSTTTQLYCGNTQVSVLLQTAMAYMHQLNDPRCGVNVRLMLDNTESQGCTKVAARVC